MEESYDRITGIALIEPYLDTNYHSSPLKGKKKKNRAVEDK
jgi:hypothetical protein